MGQNGGGRKGVRGEKSEGEKRCQVPFFLQGRMGQNGVMVELRRVDVVEQRYLTPFSHTPMFVRTIAEGAQLACVPDYVLLRPVLLELKRRCPED